jgi:hypothetical protein
MGERLMPYTGPGEAQKEQITKIATDFSKAVEAHTLNGGLVEQTKKAKVTYSKPNGVYSSSISIEEPPFLYGARGIIFHYSIDKEKGLKRDLEVEFESLPGRPSEIISSEILSPEDMAVLIKFAQDPKLYEDLSGHLLKLREEEKRILDQDRERYDRELDDIRDDFYLH